MAYKRLSRRRFLTSGAGAAGLLAFPLLCSTDAAEIASSKSLPAIEEVDALLASFESLCGGCAHASNAGCIVYPNHLPFSFRYGDEHSGEVLRRWSFVKNVLSSGSDTITHEFRYTDHVSNMEARVVATRFKHYPVLEWVVYLRNGGSSNSFIFTDIQALNLDLASPEPHAPVVHYAQGGTATGADFRPLERELSLADPLLLEPGGGRSSSEILPYFNIDVGGRGAILACGWTGEWKTSFVRSADRVTLGAGMSRTHLLLRPGEEIRTPLTSILFWNGERINAHNVFRRYVLAHHRPKQNGAPAKMPICNGNWGGTPAATHLINIDQIISHNLPMDYYWIDAEWYGSGSWWQNTGNWNVNRSLYPGGMKPISDRLHAAGRKFLLWFEPFRVSPGTPWYFEHEAWLLSVPKEKELRGISSRTDVRWTEAESRHNVFNEHDKLWNLAIPEARQFVTNFISQKIEQDGIDCYRQDFNFAPEEFWNAADAPDRKGITQIRWVEGLYASGTSCAGVIQT